MNWMPGNQNPRELSMNLEAGGQIPRELSKNWKPGSQNQPESSRITDISSRIIDEFEAWGQNGTSRNRSKRPSGRSGQVLVIFQ